MKVIAVRQPLLLDGHAYMAGQELELDDACVPYHVEAGNVFVPGVTKVDWWEQPGRALDFWRELGLDGEAPCYTMHELPGSLKIVSGCGYDPGQAAYRHHSAVNECSKHSDAFVRFGHSNPFCDLRQYDGTRNLQEIRELLHQADVVHCHMDYALVAAARLKTGEVVGTYKPPRADQLLIRHYHGSNPIPGAPSLQAIGRAIDSGYGALVVGARLNHVVEGARWLPIPMPVERYAALRRRSHEPGPVFTVAHSPTFAEYKGTGVFLDVVKRLQRKGLPIAPVLIEKRKHGDALALKAKCDAVFDSFWLGLQGSGLEGGAMDLPCVAGDSMVADLYRDNVGYVPYTFADGAEQLEQVLERLVVDAAFYAREATRLSTYVRQFHDYPAIARRYECILAEALGREDVLTSYRVQAA